jgi:hypothetical protein
MRATGVFTLYCLLACLLAVSHRSSSPHLTQLLQRIRHVRMYDLPGPSRRRHWRCGHGQLGREPVSECPGSVLLPDARHAAP